MGIHLPWRITVPFSNFLSPNNFSSFSSCEASFLDFTFLISWTNSSWLDNKEFITCATSGIIEFYLEIWSINSFFLCVQFPIFCFVAFLRKIHLNFFSLALYANLRKSWLAWQLNITNILGEMMIKWPCLAVNYNGLIVHIIMKIKFEYSKEIWCRHSKFKNHDIIKQYWLQNYTLQFRQSILKYDGYNF